VLDQVSFCLLTFFLRRLGAWVSAILLDQQNYNKTNQTKPSRAEPSVWFGLDQKSVGLVCYDGLSNRSSLVQSLNSGPLHGSRSMNGSCIAQSGLLQGSRCLNGSIIAMSSLLVVCWGSNGSSIAELACFRGHDA
jgi:hypothetical protein